MYSEKNFSIPSERCFEEKHEWGVERPKVIVLVREGNSFLYFDTTTPQVRFPETELVVGEAVFEATERVLTSLALQPESGQHNLIGYCSMGKRRIPHFMVLHIMKKPIKSPRGMAWVSPISDVVNHRAFVVIARKLLTLAAEMDSDDCLGWGDHGLIVWPCEEREVHEPVRHLPAERLAA